MDRIVTGIGHFGKIDSLPQPSCIKNQVGPFIAHHKEIQNLKNKKKRDLIWTWNIWLIGSKIMSRFTSFVESMNGHIFLYEQVHIGHNRLVHNLVVKFDYVKNQFDQVDQIS